MENPVYSFFNDLKNLVIEYVEAKLKLTKINAFETFAKILAMFFSAIIIVVFGLFVLTVLTLGFGSLLNDWLESSYLGYMILALFYLGVFLALVFFRETLLYKPITNKLIKILFKND